MNRTSRLPLLILAGSDGQAARIPHGAESMHFVVGHKGADLHLGDSCIAQLLVDRARRSQAFGGVYIVGPRRIYEPIVDCQIIDTDGGVDRNVEIALQEAAAIHGRESPLAFMACDILPQSHEIAALTAELLRQESSEELPAMALALIQVDRELGASNWKPRYAFCPAPGAQPVNFLPGHLAIVRPSCLRIGLFCRILQLAYGERNRDDYDLRSRRIVLKLLRSLLVRDLFNLLRLRAPSLTYTVLRHGLGAFFRWRRGQLDLAGLAHGMAGVLVRRQHFRIHRANSLRLVVSHLDSFAKDFDTLEELEELGENMGAHRPKQ